MTWEKEMYKDKMILCVIPARGGSKGLPGKNIFPLLGKPLIAWTIEQALASKYIDKVVVSTDDVGISEVSKKYGAEVPFLRPPELARDDSPTIDTVENLVNYYKSNNIKYDILVLLEPTSPLRKECDIDNSIKLLIDKEKTADSLVSVGKVHLENPYITKILVEGYVTPLLKENKKKIYQRQMLPDIYFPYGVIYMSKVNELLNAKTFYQERTISYEIERWQNYEIDDIYDLKCIEAILKQKKEEEKK